MVIPWFGTVQANAYNLSDMYITRELKLIKFIIYQLTGTAAKLPSYEERQK